MLTTEPSSYVIEAEAQSQALLDLLSVFGNIASAPPLQIESGKSQRDLNAHRSEDSEGDMHMSLELTIVIMESLNDLIEEEDYLLNIVIDSGTRAFEERAFERVEIHLREATLRKRAMDILSTLRCQWKELSELGRCLQEWLEDKDPMHADITVAYCAADRRLVLGTGILMQLLQKVGAESFKSMHFERALEISKHAINLRKFQRRVEEVCGENGLRQTAAQMTEIANSAA